MTKGLIYDIFRNEIVRQMAARKNILLGTQEIDSITNKNVKGKQVLDDLVSLLVQNDKNNNDDGAEYEVSVIIFYVSPRIDALLSLWEEVRDPKDLSFGELFLYKPAASMSLHTIDPLGLAEQFLEKGVRVTLIDTSGYKEAGLKPYQVLACTIMGETCSSNYDPKFLEDHKKIHPEAMEMMDPPDIAKNGKGANSTGLTEKQVDAIENELRKYDCAYSSILTHEKITIHYDSHLSANMEKCGKAQKMHPLTRDQMVTRISSLVDPLHEKKNCCRRLYSRKGK